MASWLLLATLGFAASVYVHYRLAGLTATRTRTVVTRCLLLTVAVSFAVVGLWISNTGPVVERALTFVALVGCVHMPAAAILFLKGKRRQQR